MSGSTLTGPSLISPSSIVFGRSGTIAAAVQRVWIVHLLSTRRQRSQTSTSFPRTRIRSWTGTPSRKMSLYIERPFWAPKTHTRPRRLTRGLQRRRPCQRRVSSGSAACRRALARVHQRRGSTGSLSIARTPKAHSWTRYGGSNRKHVVLARFHLVELLGEEPERRLHGRRHDDVHTDRRVPCVRTQSLLLSAASTPSLKDARALLQ